MKKNVVFVFCIIILFSACSKKDNSSTGGGGTPPPPIMYQFDSTPSWQEDFTETSFNTLSNWALYSPGPRQGGFSDTTGISFDGNNFVNKVYSDTISGVITHHAGMIRTNQEFLYGKFEAKISFVNNTGSWSAFWMQSSAVGIINPVNPQMNGMEIDIVETLHNDGAAHENLHWGGYAAPYHQTTGFITGDLGVNNGNYHIFTMEWTSAYYKFYVDGNLMWTYSTNVSRHSEFMILSSEVKNYPAGSWAGPFPSNGFGALNNTNTIMKVDYVKWYKMK
jgi:beta-glucanase (GH16 family)